MKRERGTVSMRWNEVVEGVKTTVGTNLEIVQLPTFSLADAITADHQPPLWSKQAGERG